MTSLTTSFAASGRVLATSASPLAQNSPAGCVTSSTDEATLHVTTPLSIEMAVGNVIKLQFRLIDIIKNHI